MPRMRRWLEVSLDLPADAADAAAGWLVDQGALGLIEEERNDRRLLRAHFDRTEHERDLGQAARAFLDGIDEFFPGSAAGRVEVAAFDDQDWFESWKASFPPILLGRRLCVRSPWSPPPGPERLDIEIRPAMAFGTGHHATTVGCLLGIEELFDREGALSPVLEVGTGSGILTIAAAKLGAGELCAVDVDPVAIDAASENVRRNGVEPTVRLRLGSLEQASGRFRLIVANLTSELLRRMGAGLAERAAPGGWLIVSGIVDRERDEVCAAMSAVGWMLRAERSADGWSTLTLQHLG